MSDNGSISTFSAHDSGVSAAKLRLRDWGIESDEVLAAQLAAAKSQVKGAVPWVIGAGVLFGLLSGRKGKRSAPAATGESQHSGRFMRVAKLAFEFMPVVLPLVSRMVKSRR